MSIVNFFVMHDFNFVHIFLLQKLISPFFSRRVCVGSLTEKRRRRLVPSVLRFCNHVTVCLLQVSLQDEVVSVILYYFGGRRFEDWECYFWRLQDISTPDFFNLKVQPQTFHPQIFQPWTLHLWFFQPQKFMVEMSLVEKFGLEA